MDDFTYDMIARREGRPTREELRFREIEAKIAKTGYGSLTSGEMHFYEHNRPYYVNDEYAYKHPVANKPKLAEPVIEAVDTADDPVDEEQQQHNGELSDGGYFVMKKFFGF